MYQINSLYDVNFGATFEKAQKWAIVVCLHLNSMKLITLNMIKKYDYQSLKTINSLN